MADHAATAHGHPNYIKVWAILLVLLVVSTLGPMLEIKVLTLITAFGVAIIKAYMVAKNFMHLNIERSYVIYLILTMLVFVLLYHGLNGVRVALIGTGFSYDAEARRVQAERVERILPLVMNPPPEVDAQDWTIAKSWHVLPGGKADAVAQNAAEARSRGYRHIKLHEITVPEVKAGREASGPGVPLMIDTNCPWTVREAIEESFAYERLVVVTGMLGDKLVEDVLDVWTPLGHSFVLTAPQAERDPADPDRLAEALEDRGVPRERIEVVPAVIDAVRTAVEGAGPDDLVLVTGSFYTVGEARGWLRSRGAVAEA